MPSYLNDQEVYVSKAGNDTTGDGTIEQPFLTIAKAMSVIPDNSTTKRYAILVGPGAYADAWGLKPYVAVKGSVAATNGATSNGAAMVEITAPADSIGFDASWTSASGFSVAFLENLAFTNHQTWDQSVATGMQPQINMRACEFNGGFSALGPGTSGTDNLSMEQCLVYGGITFTGWQFLWTKGCTFLGGTVAISAAGSGALEDTKWLSQGDSIGAATSPTNVSLTGATGAGAKSAKADWSNTSQVGNTTLTNATTSFTSTTGGPWNVTLAGGASIPTINLPYNPAAPASWASVPTTVGQALDRIAAKIGGPI